MPMPPIASSRRAQRRDKLARWVITLGGVTVIASVVAILAMIVGVTVPLFRASAGRFALQCRLPKTVPRNDVLALGIDMGISGGRRHGVDLDLRRLAVAGRSADRPGDENAGGFAGNEKRRTAAPRRRVARGGQIFAGVVRRRERRWSRSPPPRGGMSCASICNPHFGERSGRRQHVEPLRTLGAPIRIGHHYPRRPVARRRRSPSSAKRRSRISLGEEETSTHQTVLREISPPRSAR